MGLMFIHLSSVSISLPLFFCIFLSWAVSSSTSPPSPPPSSTTDAAEILKHSGYSLFAAAIEASLSDNREQFNRWDGTGTLFAAPDFAFKKGRGPIRPNSSLLSYHTLRQIFNWDDLSIRLEGEAFPTFSPRRCIFKCKNPAGELCFAGKKKPVGDYLRIRYPDLFVSENLIIHGVDSILDPSSASICTDYDSSSPTTAVDFSFLDQAVKTLKQRGYGVVATALAMQRSDLVNLTGITVFAPRDEDLFGLANGFRYDLRYHVVPQRIQFADLAILPYGKKIETLVHGEPIVVGSINGTITVNGVKIEDLEIYHNDKVVLLAVPRPLHISVGSGAVVSSPVMSQDSGEFSQGLSDSGEDRRFVSPSNAPYPAIEVVDSPDLGDLAPKTFSEFDEEDQSGGDSNLSPSPATMLSVSAETRCAPAGSPLKQNGAISAALSSVGSEPYCPITSRSSRNVDVAPSAPSPY